MTGSLRTKLAIATAAWALAAFACNSIVGNSDVQLGNDGGGAGGGGAGGGGAGGGGGAAGSAGGGAGGGAGSDAGDGGAPDAQSTTYNDMTNGANWSAVDLSSLPGFGNGYIGGTYDGQQYLYLAPNNNGLVVQYDTHQAFAVGSFATFDTTTLDPSAFGFAGAVFDGRYVYFVPDNHAILDGSPPELGLLVSFDTQASGGFTNQSSWAIFDLTTVAAQAVGYAGATFDGHFVYFGQHEDNGSGLDSLNLRYDPTGGFDAAAFTTFSVAPVVTGLTEFDMFGSVFDGRYVYYAHHDFGGGVMLQFDTTGTFVDAGSWAAFNDQILEVPDGGGSAYTGAAYDGKHVYFVPNGGGVPAAQALEYDPAAGPFTNASAWSTFIPANTDSRATGFAGGAFDGRYVYLVPNINGLGADGVIARFDTTGTFTSTTAWQTYDITSSPNVGAQGIGFFGAVFDGQYLYLVPNRTSTFVRFDAKAPSSMPVLYPSGPPFYGSFL